MKHLTIIVPDGENNLSSMVGAYKKYYDRQKKCSTYWFENETGKSD